MNIKTLAGWFVYIAASSVVIAIIGGGVAFIQRPVGVIYLILWVVWWIVTVLGRQRGVSSAYGEKQWVRTVLGIIALLVLILVSPWEYASFTGPIPRDGWLTWVGLALFTAGIYLQSVAMWALRSFFTVRLAVQSGQHLVTSGPYRLVRHPGYLSYIICLTGIGLTLSSLVALGITILVVLFLLWRIRREEEMLAAEFGEEYRTYLKRTKWRLIPLVY